MPEKKKTAAAAPAVEAPAAEAKESKTRKSAKALHAAAVPRLHRSCTWSSAANSTT